MEIQVATSKDCRGIAELHVQVWRDAYRDILRERYLASLSMSERDAMWRRMVERWPTQLLVARVAGKIVGFVAFGASRDKDAPADRAEIWAIYVAATSWSTGIGRCLWLQAQQRIVAEGYKSASRRRISANHDICGRGRRHKANRVGACCVCDRRGSVIGLY